MKKIYQSDKITITSKKGMEHGQEADMADEVFDACLGGWRSFANHLEPKAKREFYRKLRTNLKEIIDNFLK